MYWFRGEIALMMVPSDRQAMPSHWKPGRSPLKPRSTRISTEVPAEVPQASGTSPRSRSHLVLQGRPQAAPCSWGVNSCRRASSTGTGSSGASQLLSVSGTLRG
ncbi:hypothetical protein ABH915_000971 [Arthrobacter sp. MW3 TE3886]